MRFNFTTKYSVILASFLGISTAIIAQNSSAEALPSMVPSTISINQAHTEKTPIELDGNTLYLPKINKEVTTNEWATLGPSFILEVIEKIIPDTQELKEMLNLSDKLGIKIDNTENLPLYREAVSWLGTRYKFAGNGRKGIDCSGFTNMIYRNVYDRNIARMSTLLAKDLKEELPARELEPGDLVFFSTRGRARINHVGVYIGQGHFVHASIKDGVKVSSLSEGYYAKTYIKGGKI